MLKPEPELFPVKNKLDTEQLFKISRFKEVIKRTKPHKHDGYFEIIILLEGAGFHRVDTRLLPIAPPMAFFLSPGQLHCWELTAVPKGFVLMFRSGFIDPEHNSDLYRLVQQLQQIREIALPEPGDVFNLLTEIDTEFRQASPHRLIVLRALMQILLSRLLSIGQTQPVSNRAAELTFRRFTGLLHEAGAIAHRVADYADRLGVSPQHLNNICRRTQGKSAGELITSQIILESKRYLLHTDYSVTEIAEHLGFSDPSHFVKYFKKHAGCPPATFRRQYGF